MADQREPTEAAVDAAATVLVAQTAPHMDFAELVGYQQTYYRQLVRHMLVAAELASLETADT